MKAAAAIFVKTPGVSPVKTRLAEKIGKEKAEEFHLLSAASVKAVVQDVMRQNPSSWEPYWAVAEEAGLSFPAWQEGKQILQGADVSKDSESLGARLDSVYRKLLETHDAVFLIGADVPQIEPYLFNEALERIEKRDNFVLGPSEDGGFYLFAGARSIPTEVWQKVTYGNDQTSKQLVEQLAPVGKTHVLETLSDVDVYQNLVELHKVLCFRETLLPEQRALLAFINNLMR